MRTHLNLLFGLLLCTSISNVEAQITWMKHPTPVVSVWAGDINDPSSYKYIYNPAVIFDSTTSLYKMWYCYQAFGFGVQWCIGYAVSTDGMNWYTYSKNPVLRPGGQGSFDSNSLFDPFVIRVDNELRLYYDGYNGSLWQTGVATSTDGITWTKHPGNPILAVRPGTWEAVGCNAPKVLHNGNNFVMFYTGHDNAMLAEVGLATSTDGYSWERYPLNPVLRRGPVGSWDEHSIRGTAAFTGNEKCFLLYDGGGATPIGFASSVDGVTWTKYSGNPVFFPGSSGSWDAERVEIGSVIREGSQLKFWYSGFGYHSTLGGSVWQIGLASSDFVTSTPESGNGLPGGYRLMPAFPNPFNPETEIRFSIPGTEHVVLKIFDSLGRLITTLVDDIRPGGTYSVRWKPESSASGVYFYRISAGGFSETGKVTLLK